MKKNFIFIANWKMYLNTYEEINLATKNYDHLVKLKTKNNSHVILMPSIISLKTINEIFQSTNVKIGSQNCSSHAKGSFTGQISAESLNKLGIEYCIIGHSETRKELNESDFDIEKKFERLINNKITPVLCIGENEQEYNENKTIDKIESQINNIIKKIDSSINDCSKYNLYIAYEPIWSIGSGNIANIDHLETIFAWLYKKLSKINNRINFKLIYGGSVNSRNISKLNKISNIDGFLIGKSSLDFKEFEKIVELGSI